MSGGTIKHVLNLFILWSFLLTFSHTEVQAAWEDPPIELLEDGLEGISVEVDSGINKIIIWENVGNESVGGFDMVKLKPDPPTSKVEKTSTDARFNVNMIEENGNQVWVLNVSSHFDFENLKSPLLVVPLKSEDGTSLIVTIEVLDENDNAPYFVKMEPSQVEPIKELQLDSDHVIVTIEAKDDDAADKVLFSVEEDGEESEYFQINDIGELTLKKELNYSIKSSHRLNIILSDDREPYHKTPVGVTILVEDIPNRAPEFTRPPMIRSVKENLTEDTLIATVQARDGDYGLNWEIEYSIESIRIIPYNVEQNRVIKMSSMSGFVIDKPDLFKIDPKTGQIKVKSIIDAESKELIEADLTHEITIIATEKTPDDYLGPPPENPSTSETVIFSIEDINDNPPRLCLDENNCNPTESYSFSITEDFIGQIDDNGKPIWVIDIDATTSFNSFTVGFAAGTNDIIKSAFSIAPTRGSETANITLSVSPTSSEWIDVENDKLNDFWLTSRTFTVEIVPTDPNTDHKASAEITASVVDINDNPPVFKFPTGKTQYEFYVCENTEDGTVLRNVVADQDQPKSCPKEDSEDWEVIKIEAEDRDKNPEFGQASVRYRFSSSGRQPPIILEARDGTMKMNRTAGNFDYERFQSEVYMAEAVDYDGASGSLTDTAPVTLYILDRNDETVDLRLTSGSRATVKEGTPLGPGEFILDGIIATDVDTTANIELTMELSSTFRRAKGSYDYQLMSIYGELEDKMKDWFYLQVDADSIPGEKKARIVLGNELPDREGYSNGDVIIDRVDLIIKAEDKNSDGGPGTQVATQVVTIMIEDINDHPPRWVDDGDINLSVLETEDWGENGEDTEGPYQREIYTFRATDPDTNTVFKFEFDNPDCEFGEELCKEILDLFELDHANDKVGTAVLRRKQGKLIDRELPQINDHDDKIKLTITVWDSDSDPKNSLTSEIEIHVEDRNDNTPEFTEDYNAKSYSVKENGIDKTLIGTIIATDKDHPSKFGNVSYLLVDEDNEGDNNGIGKFDLHLITGELTDCPGEYDWFDIREFRVRVKAIDYYRPSATSGSNFRYMFLLINVDDYNNHAPEFLTPQGGSDNPLNVVKESETDPATPFANGINIQDKDDPSKPNGEFAQYVKIASVTKKPSFPDDPPLESLFKLGTPRDIGDKNEKEFMIYPTKSLLGLWGEYTLKLEASDGPNSDPEPLPNSAEYIINVENENMNAPEFFYPEDNSTYYYLAIGENRPGAPIRDIRTNAYIPNTYAEDRDKGSGNNGIVTYTLESNPDEGLDCTDLFQITDVFGTENVTGLITLRKELSEEDHANEVCELVIKASDKGQPPQSSSRTVKMYLFVDKNSPPAFQSPNVTIFIAENATGLGEFVQFPYPYDPDIENENPLRPNDKIYYMLKGGDSNLFTLEENPCKDNPERLCPGLKPKQMLDYEVIKMHLISVYATNFPDEDVPDTDPENVNPTNTQWIVVIVDVVDVKDYAPKFLDISEGGVITGGFTVKDKPRDPIKTVVAIDPDTDDFVTFTKTTEFKPSDPSSLPTLNPPPFTLDPSESEQNQLNILLQFEPQERFRGYFEFNLTATDTVGMQAVAICRLYMVANNNIVKMLFSNELGDVEPKKDELARILSEVFEPYRCNIHNLLSVPDDGGSNATLTSVETHFINLETNELVLASSIEEQQYDLNKMRELSKKLTDNDFDFKRFASGDKIEEEPSEIVTYILIGGIAVLTITLFILGATCYYNNRSLSRRVRALTATTFGSQASDINRMGAMDSTPNTNAFAIEGSNPIWTVDNENKKMPEFDTSSVGSGGSVLIGAEDEDYFKKSTKNPMFQAEDVIANYDSDNDDFGADRTSRTSNAFDNDNFQYGRSFANEMDQNINFGDDNYERNDRNNNMNAQGEDPPFSAKTRRNPLMNLGDNQISVDVDAIAESEDDDGYDFEQNTDGTLF